jgi:ADP-ribose pyrophosphatase
VIILSPDEIADVPLAWPVTATRVLAEGKIVTFREDDIETPDGKSITREYIKHPGAVGIIAMDDEQRVVLVRQYRHPVRHRLVEPPAGLLDVDGEDYVVAAQRELAEEVGFGARTWNVLVDIFSSPGIIGETIRIYLARDLSEAAAPDDFLAEGEEAHMDIVWAPLADLTRAVLDGRVHNPTLVPGVLAAWSAWNLDGFASLRPGDAPWPARDAVLHSSGE